MNATTRSSRVIVGNTFSVFCDNDSSVEVFRFSSGQLSTVSVTYTQKENDFKEAEIASSQDGYYFVRSGRNVQSLKKGNIPYQLFLFDGNQNEDLELEPESFDMDGHKIGDNTVSHIGYGIYVIDPMVLNQSIVKVRGKIFHSFPNAENSDCPDVNRAATTVTLSPQEEVTVISIGGTKTGVSVEDSNVGLSVEQTTFKV